MSTGWNMLTIIANQRGIINLLGNEYWLEPKRQEYALKPDYKPTGK